MAPTAYIIFAALLVAIPTYIIVMDLLSNQARQDAYDELMEDER